MDYVALHARLRPAKTAIVDLAHDRQWSYAQLDRFIDSCVSVLLGHGLEMGGRVACLSKNRAEMVVLHLACARLGAIFVPLNWRLAAAELAVLIEDCAPSVLFGDSTADDMGIDCITLATLVDCCAASEASDLPAPSADAPSLILYTSGTTGKPKGVMLSERNITETAINFSILGEVDEGSGFLCESPMFHIIGLITSIRPAFLRGAHVVISDGFLPERTLSRLAEPEFGISHYFCVPQMALALRGVPGFSPQKLRHMKALFTGGAPHPEAQIRDWLEDGIAIVDGYGSSEAGTVFGMPLDRTLIDRKAGCVGVPTPRIQHRVVDEANRPLSPGIAGELQLKGDNVTRGYWQRESDYLGSFTEDGWFRTGDIVIVDEDGFYRIVDRKKDMYISGGENVYPAEIESLLVKYPPFKEVSVVGVPDEQWGEVGCVFYVADVQEVTPEAISEYLSGKLARYKLPRKSCRVDRLPRNGAGKILKHELRSAFLTANSS